MIFGGGGGSAKIPTSAADRDNQAISAVKAAISKPKTKDFPLIECEFPPLKELNKLGDGSLRSANEVDQANLAFCIKMVKSIAPIPIMGPKIWLLTSSASTNAFVAKAQGAAKGTAATVDTLRNGIPQGLAKGDICILISPTGRPDYNLAQTIITNNSDTTTQKNAVVIVNGLAKDPESVPGTATMAYFLKPLTYNSMVSGFLIRSYPGPWTVLDAVTKKSLGSFTDQEILFQESNTPDLRSSGRLVQKATDERAIAARKR
ncbi:MAG: hypothetical protein SGILL_006443 [Bacillariaceae sp.]